MKKLLRKQQVLDILEISREKLPELIALGEIPAGKPITDDGRTLYWVQSDIENFIDRRYGSHKPRG